MSFVVDDVAFCHVLTPPPLTPESAQLALPPTMMSTLPIVGVAASERGPSDEALAAVEVACWPLINAGVAADTTERMTPSWASTSNVVKVPTASTRANALTAATS